MPTDTYMQTRCPNPECRREYRVKAEFEGKTATCKGCGKKFVLAAGTGVVAAPNIHSPQPRVPVPQPVNQFEAGGKGSPNPDKRFFKVTLSCVGVVLLGLATWLYFATRPGTAQTAAASPTGAENASPVSPPASVGSKVSPGAESAKRTSAKDRPATGERANTSEKTNKADSPGSFVGLNWRGKLTSAEKVPAVPQGFRQIDGWAAHEGSTLVVVRGTIEAVRATPKEGWVGDVGMILRREGAALVDTHIATLDSGVGLHKMVGFITDETSVSGDTWVRCFATTTTPGVQSKVAMVFTAPRDATLATIMFAGGGSVQLKLSDPTTKQPREVQPPTEEPKPRAQVKTTPPKLPQVEPKRVDARWPKGALSVRVAGTPPLVSIDVVPDKSKNGRPLFRLVCKNDSSEPWYGQISVRAALDAPPTPTGMAPITLHWKDLSIPAGDRATIDDENAWGKAEDLSAMADTKRPRFASISVDPFELWIESSNAPRKLAKDASGALYLEVPVRPVAEPRPEGELTCTAQWDAAIAGEPGHGQIGIERWGVTLGQANGTAIMEIGFMGKKLSGIGKVNLRIYRKTGENDIATVSNEATIVVDFGTVREP